MLIRLGVIIFLLGTTAADSPSLLAPFSLMALGALLICVGRRLEDAED